MDKPVIVINIDDTAFTQFQDRYNKYYESLETMPALWKDINAEMAVTNASMDKLANQAKAEKKPLDPRAETLDKAKTLRLKEDEKSWAKIQKHATTTSREVSGLARMTIGLASGGKLGSLGAGLGVAGAFGALYGAIESAAKSLAALNLQGRALNLAPGQAQAFTTAYSGIGASEDLLSKLASAKMDSTKWTPLLAAGLTPEQIQSEDPIELSESLFKAVRKGDLERGVLGGGQWRRGTGISNLIDDAQANRLSSYSDDDLNGMHAEYLKDVPKFARSQADADAGTGLKNHLAENWADISKSFDHAAIILAPQLEAWSDAATKLSKDVLEKLPGWLKKAEDFYDKDVAPVMPKLGTGGDALDDAAITVGRTLTDKDKWKALWSGVKNSGIKSGGASLKPAWDMDHPFGTWNHSQSADPAGDATGTDARHNPGNMRPRAARVFRRSRPTPRACARRTDSYSFITTATRSAPLTVSPTNGHRPATVITRANTRRSLLRAWALPRMMNWISTTPGCARNSKALFSSSNRVSIVT
ncbi:hypothetical protein AX768_13410 [Burkholderia sp. PAMC 28687]|uniref:hypothetical protein n=1 Tax=Burkholderia sp. PAMC 28687 TaxID=1795874 RepID=UPI000780D481|nr:hypothetical protein [Burkholderia sp. PAMC 28687]AMM14947.1 hypothetical protein AX768_13410 [Burkholderia sp. PAMC 28687]